MPKLVDLTDRTFGKLHVLARGANLNRAAAWICACACGRQTVVRGQDLTTGSTKSCGCQQGTGAKNRPSYHGLKDTGAYRAWQDMKKRCYAVNRKDYKHYGGRGITVCERWHRFQNFLADMGERPEGMSLERRDNAQGYSPTNCYWADTHDQHRNQRSNVWLEVGSLRMIKEDWAKELNTVGTTLDKRLERGWPIEAVCTLPVLRNRML